MTSEIPANRILAGVDAMKQSVLTFINMPDELCDIEWAHQL